MEHADEYEYESGAVRISVPAQPKKVKVRPLAKDTALEGRAAGGFRPLRVVINFQVEDETKSGELITDFNPPFELRVRYTPADALAAQKAGLPLVLAFWDGSTWVKFTAEKHSFRLEPDAQGGGGAGIALIRNWGDPNVAWGT